MPMREALIIEAGGERFRFYYDLEVPEVLHIMLRHGTTPEDAFRAFYGRRREVLERGATALRERDRDAWPLLDAPPP